MFQNPILRTLAVLIVFVTALIFSPLVFFSLILPAILAMAAWEWARLLNCPLKYAILYSVAVVLVSLANFFTAGFLSIYYLLCPTLLFWAIYVPYALYLGVRTINFGERLFLMLIGIAVLSTFGLSFLLACLAGGSSNVLSLLAIIWISDIGAYFIGKTFGRHKLAAHISSKKTIEGTLGGLCTALLFTIALAILSNTFGTTFSETSIIQHGRGSAILLVILCVGAGIIGDLFASLLKRQANVKNSGRFLPDYGGALSRVSALLPAIPLAVSLEYLLRILSQ